MTPQTIPTAVGEAFADAVSSAAREAGRRSVADASVGRGPGGSRVVTLSSSRARAVVPLDLVATPADGGVEVAIRDGGDGPLYPLGRLAPGGTGADRVLARLRHADHWLALHLRDRFDAALEARSRDRADRLRLGLRRPIRIALAVAAVAGAYALGGVID